jgi:Zn-dependent membrane protease YugP
MRALSTAGKVWFLTEAQTEVVAMIRNRRVRRSAAGALIAVGILLMMLAPSVGAGLVLFALGIVLELVGLALEHRDPPA